MFKGIICNNFSIYLPAVLEREIEQPFWLIERSNFVQYKLIPQAPLTMCSIHYTRLENHFRMKQCLPLNLGLHNSLNRAAKYFGKAKSDILMAASFYL